jgi:two-component system cell cycle sensor histidine kinase/response regulator CckA
MLNHLVHRPTNVTAGLSRQGELARSQRILIVEDDTLMRHFVDQVLRSAGYTTARVVDGEEALEFCESFWPFDLLLTDLVMPRMYGTEVARRLRQAYPTIKVLYFTGYSDQLFIEKGELWDEEAFLEKPSTVDGLLEAVSLLLDGHIPRSPVIDMVPQRH